MPYTKEQYESDKAIVENAPNGADEFFIYNHTVNYIDNHENGHQFKIWDDEDNEWVFSELVDGWEYIRGRRSLQDIRDKIELYETVEKLKDWVTLVGATGFPFEGHDSGLTHREVCKKYTEIVKELKELTE